MAISGTNEIYRKLSSQIESQFPEFIREEGPKFVLFLKAYFEYLEQDRKAGDATRGLFDYIDIDRTLDAFVENFHREFMPSIPRTARVNKALLIKHIREFYRSKGSQNSYRFLFRVLFDKEIDFYYPGDDILRASDGRWVKETVVRGIRLAGNPHLLDGRVVTGSISAATGRVQEVLKIVAFGVELFQISIENASGTFQDNETVTDSLGNSITISGATGSITGVTMKGGGGFHHKGDTIALSGAEGGAATGTITGVTESDAMTFRIVNGGSGYRKANTIITVSGGNAIVPASFSIVNLSNTANITVNQDVINGVKNITLNNPSFFIRSGANTTTVRTKLTGKIKLDTSSNTILGLGTNFSSQLTTTVGQPGNIVRITGHANTLRVHSIASANSFVAVFRPTVTIGNPGANSYIGLAGANVSTTLTHALTFATVTTGSINTIALLNPGYGYTSKPTVTVVDNDIVVAGLTDADKGGIKGQNAVIVANTIIGSITSISISTSTTFVKNDNLIITNSTRSAANTTDTSTDIKGSLTRGLIRKGVFSANASPTIAATFILAGRYIDTKGLLSWNNVLQDNSYYQEFSYVLKVSTLVNDYRNFIKSLVHPAGMRMFGIYKTESVGSIAANFAIDSITVTSGAEFDISMSGAVSETITLTDTPNAGIAFGGAIEENSAFIEPYAAVLVSAQETAEISRFVTDVHSITDTPDAGLNFIIALADLASIIDIYSATLISVYEDTPISIFEGLELAEAPDAAFGYTVTIENLSGLIDPHSAALISTIESVSIETYGGLGLADEDNATIS